MVCSPLAGCRNAPVMKTTGIKLVASEPKTKLPHGFLDHVGKQAAQLVP